MRTTKARPILYVWVVLAVHRLLVVGLDWFAFSIHKRASGLVKVQRETAGKAAAARAGIEAETDISTLRRLALNAHDHAEAHFSSEVHIFNALDVFSCAILVVLAVNSTFIGLAIYGLSQNEPNRLTKR